MTTNELLIDRGYIIKKERDVSYKQFLERYKSKCDLNYLTEKIDNIKDKIIILYTNEFNKDEIKKIYTNLNKLNTRRCIVVLFEKKKINHRDKLIIEKLNDLGYIIEIFFEHELLFNVTRNKYVPKHILICDESTKSKLISDLKINDIYECMPKILIDDPQSKYYGAQRGDIFKIVRKSEATGTSLYYRLVI